MHQINQDDYIPAKSDLEKQLVELYAEVLNLNVTQIGIRSNFFRLGGNSILAIKLINLINNKLSLNIKASAFIEHLAIENLANYIEQSPEDGVVIPHYKLKDTALQVLSFAQEGLWFIEQYSGGSNAYNIPLLLKVAKYVDLDILELCFKYIVQRHEILRTVIRQTSSKVPYQFILDEASNPFTIIRESVSDKNKLRNKLYNDANHIFDLSNEYPLRIQIYEYYSPSKQKSEHYVSIVCHHIATDGWSMDIAIKELYECYRHYEAQANKQLSKLNLPKLTIQYKDYALWQKNYMTGDRLDRFSIYWQNKLAGYEDLNLVTDKIRPLEIEYVGEDVVFEIDAKLSKKLRNLANELQVSLFSVLLSSYYLMLRVYANQDDLVVGTPMANRHYQQTENAMGLFVNSLPVRVSIDAEQKIKDYIKVVGKNVVETQLHQEFPFEKIVECLNVAKDNSRHPIFQTMFLVQSFGSNVPKIHNDISGKVSYLFEKYSDRSLYRVAKFDLTLAIDDSRDTLTGSFNYAISLFNQETIGKFIATYKVILSHISELASNKQKYNTMVINDLTYLNQDDYKQQVLVWNKTASDYPSTTTIHELFEAQVEKTPDNIAIIYEGVHLSYSKLNHRVNQLARYLRQQHQIQPNNLIAICLDRSEHLIISILAILKAGGAYVPMDPVHPDQRLSYILEDAKAKLILTNQAYATRFKNIIKSAKLVSSIEIIDAQATQNILVKLAINNLNNILISTDLLCIAYTSGTSGKPKGVMLEHKGIVNRIFWGYQNFPYDINEICCFKTSVNFVDHIAEILSPLLFGKPLLLLGNNITQIGFNLDDFIDYLANYHVTRLTLVPSLLDVLLDHESLPKLHAIKFYFTSGENIKQKTINKFYAKLPKATLINIYGSSEVSADATYRILVGNSPFLDYFHDGLNLVQQAYAGKKDIARINEEHTESFSKVLTTRFEFTPLVPKRYVAEVINKGILPNIIDCSNPKFMGHMVSVLPEFNYEINNIVGLLNQNVVKIETSKVLIHLERTTISMLHQMFYNKDDNFYQRCNANQNLFCGVSVSGGTIANLTALWAARNNAFPRDGKFAGVDIAGMHSALTYYGYSNAAILVSELAHYSFVKSSSILGLGKENIGCIKLDNTFKASICDLQAKIADLEAKKVKIIAIVGIAGTTESGTVDDLELMSKIAQKHNIHFHVDAAFGGAFMFSKVRNGLFKGIENADSITVCGHKQLFLPMGISLCLFKDPTFAKNIFTTADYQSTLESFDLGKASPEGSRSAISLCLHASLTILGQSGYNQILDICLANTQYLVNCILELDCFELMIHPTLNIVNYRYIPNQFRDKYKTSSFSLIDNNIINDINQQIQVTQFNNGDTFISKTIIPYIKNMSEEIVVFRAVLCNPLTKKRDILEMLINQINIANNITSDDDNKHIYYLKNLANIVDILLPTIGKPMNNTQVFILDGKRQPLPIGAIGELYIGGAGLARGYLNLPELTQEKFITNPFQTLEDRAADNNSRLYKTGDLARWLPDGNLEYIGRNDSQVKIRGYRIELGEIEAKLSNYPGIKQCVVVCLESGESNNVKSVSKDVSNKYLVGYYVADSELKQEQLLAKLAQELPKYMIPSILVHLTKIPLMINGKLDKKALPIPEFTNRSSSYLAPRTELEQQLTEVYAKILNLDANKISISDSFFRLGGNSIKVINLVGILNQEYKSNLKLSDVFTYPDIMNLAIRVSQTRSKYKILIKLNRTRNKPKLFMIHPGHGGCEVYTNLSNELKNRYSCYGVDSYNLYSENKITDLSQLAEYYLSEINKVMYKSKQADYYLLGWSLGGKIALEIAAILEKRKPTLKVKVYLFDTLIIDKKIVKYYSQKYLVILKQNLLQDMQLLGYAQLYIDRVLAVVDVDYQLYKQDISHKLVNTEVILYKATQPIPAMLQNLEWLKLDKYVQCLEYNNINLIHLDLRKVSVFKVENSHHDNIINQDIITKLIV